MVSQTGMNLSETGRERPADALFSFLWYLKHTIQELWFDHVHLQRTWNIMMGVPVKCFFSSLPLKT